eukprot:comp14567_c0_seq2/m.10821 comp14567_c0_seq2/g.10821  ORF comp14567_c0_seq2/g.10821 comp14567_c0_seq2/m.10821 type:complete len:321 (-) comp14567_c0_seq2:200-1162(-)
MERLPTWGTDTICESVKRMAGGSALNVAVHLASLISSAQQQGLAQNTSVTFHSIVGADDFGEFSRQRVDRVPGLRNSMVTSERWGTGVCVILSSKDDRAFITQPGAVSRFTSADLPELATLPRPGVTRTHIHLAGYFSTNEFQKDYPAMIQGIRQRASEQGSIVTFSFDTNYDASESWVSALDILPLIDVFLPNETEAELIGGVKGFEESALKLATYVKDSAVVTCGSRGAVVAKNGNEGVSWVSAVPGVQPVDSTGAGDAFAAGFLAQWVGGVMDEVPTIENATRYGNQVAALVTTIFGANTELATVDRINQFLAGQMS